VGYFAAYAAEKRYDPTASPDGAWSDDERARAILVLLGEEALEGEYRSKADTFARASRIIRRNQPSASPGVRTP